MGTFGPFEVTLSLDADGSAAFFIDGPNVGISFSGNQCAGAYLSRTEMLNALDEGLKPPTDKCAWLKCPLIRCAEIVSDGAFS